MEKNVTQIEAMIREHLNGDAVQVVAVQVRLSGSAMRVAAVLDTPAGITIDECAMFNRRLRELLEPLFPDISVEVCSPGLDRALKTEQDFQRVIGKQVKMVCLAPGGRTRELRGVVSTVASGTVGLTTPAGRDEVTPLDDIITAKQEIRWPHGK